MTELNDIPEEQVPQVIQAFILSGKSLITIEKQADDKWTVRGE